MFVIQNWPVIVRVPASSSLVKGLAPRLYYDWLVLDQLINTKKLKLRVQVSLSTERRPGARAKVKVLVGKIMCMLLFVCMS